MTLAAAQQFIQRAVNDREMVCRINSAANRYEVRQILSELDLCFDQDEFEPAFFNVLTWCRTFEQAEAVKEVKMWWDFLGIYLERSENS